LRLLQQAGWQGAVAFEASVQCQQRPRYDALAAAERTYRWMAEAWKQVGVASSERSGGPKGAHQPAK
jgi:hypothetical protein